MCPCHPLPCDPVLAGCTCVGGAGVPKAPLSHPPSPSLAMAVCRRVHDGQSYGVWIAGAGTRGRLEGCDVARNKGAGVYITAGADPVLAASK